MDGSADLGICCSHVPEGTFLHGAAYICISYILFRVWSGVDWEMGVGERGEGPGGEAEVEL